MTSGGVIPGKALPIGRLRRLLKRNEFGKYRRRRRCDDEFDANAEVTCAGRSDLCSAHVITPQALRPTIQNAAAGAGSWEG